MSLLDDDEEALAVDMADVVSGLASSRRRVVA